LGIDPQKKASPQERGRPCKFSGIDGEKKEWFAKFLSIDTEKQASTEGKQQRFLQGLITNLQRRFHRNSRLVSQVYSESRQGAGNQVGPGIGERSGVSRLNIISRGIPSKRMALHCGVNRGWYRNYPCEKIATV
jgi:hypothetical protein